MDFIHPDLTRKIHEQQQKQKVYHDKKAREWNFCVGDPVLTPVPVAQWLEHCVSSAKVVGSIPREHMY